MSEKTKTNWMRFFLCSFLFLILSCSATKEQNDERVSLPPPHINCPEDGDCSFEVLKNSSLNFAYDTTGKLYPEITEGEKIVIKYHYKRKTIENVMDSNYSEYVYLEFDPNDRQIILKDKELQKVKMIFGRICYCKGSMGYFRVKEGSLFLFTSNGNLGIRASFEVNKIPQIIDQIDENIKF